MDLALENVASRVGAQQHIHPLSMTLAPGAINVLLGATLAGKTSLMRLMAGLDRPNEGRVIAGGRDVTGVPVRERDLAMVYQQFINYPSFTVFDNIASPLRIKRVPETEVRRRVHEMAERLHITPYLARMPSELSGGQQQRTALARALVKQAGLLLLDEPLVNLDYKLREELRRELATLFAEGDTTVVYATTEPQEALLLGGHVALLHQGSLLQSGPTVDVFAAPCSVTAARTFSDPPINLLPARLDGNGNAVLADGLALALAPQQRRLAGTQPELVLGVRAHSLRLTPGGEDQLAIDAEVELSEISGSETFLHAHRGSLALVAQLQGVQDLPIGSRCTLYCPAADVFLFDADGGLLYAPQRREA